MKILVTGSNGFVGKNLISELHNRGYHEIYEVNRDTTDSQLERYCKEVTMVFHLAGVNRSINTKEFEEGNVSFTKKILSILNENNNKCPVIFTSSTQATLDNMYGHSKKKAEEEILLHSIRNKSVVQIYRVPNVFGKWSKPNYNSVIATFCHNIARDIPVTIHDNSAKIKLIYIDDLINIFIENMNKITEQIIEIDNYYEKTVKEIADLLKRFKVMRTEKFISNVENEFEKRLYSTYLSYLPTGGFSVEAKMNVDDRGSFTELFKTLDRGQVSINISKPGIVKGNHWHHTKNEKFVVVSGEGVIRFRKYDDDKIIEYSVTGDKIEIIDIPVGYTHNIENTGTNNLVTVMWVNELFDKEKPDTYFLEV